MLPEPEALLHTLPSDEAFLTELQRRYNNLLAIIFEDTEVRELFVPLLRADFNLVETYQYTTKRALPCPLVALGGEADPRGVAGVAGVDAAGLCLASLSWWPFLSKRAGATLAGDNRQLSFMTRLWDGDNAKQRIPTENRTQCPRTSTLFSRSWWVSRAWPKRASRLRA